MRWVVLSAVLLSVLAASPRSDAEQGSRDPLEMLRQIRAVFLEGNYERVEQLAEELLESDPSMLVRAESLQFLGASLELMGRTEEAEEQFEVLLTLQPEYHMNQADFPTEVVSLFETVRLRVQDRLDQIEEQRRRAQDVERRERERRLLEQQQRLLELARPRYLVRQQRPQHLVVSLLPFGAGQFQNGHESRGWAFFGVELGLTGASMLVWMLGSLVSEDEAGAERFAGYQISSYVLAGALAVSVIWGMIDGLVHFLRQRRQGDRWQEVEAEEVPEEYRIEVDPDLLRLAPGANPEGAPAGP